MVFRKQNLQTTRGAVALYIVTQTVCVRVCVCVFEKNKFVHVVGVDSRSAK